MFISETVVVSHLSCFNARLRRKMDSLEAVVMIASSVSRVEYGYTAML